MLSNVDVAMTISALTFHSAKNPKLINIYVDLENSDMEHHFGNQLFDESIVIKDESV